MQLGLRPGLSFGIADGRAIFLDSDADRYFCLPSDLNQRFLSLLSSTADVSAYEPAILALLNSDAADPLTPTTIVAATAHLLPESHDCASASQHLACLVAQTVSRLSAGRTLRANLCGVARHQSTARDLLNCADHPMAVARLLRAFDKTRWLYNAQDRCLAQSISLSHFLASQGLKTSLVIGVRPRPFSAHCWLQSGTTVLNDHLETTQTYIPVRVVA